MAHLLHLSHEWDFASYGTCELAWEDDAGSHTVTFSSGIYRHTDASADSLTHPSGGLAIANTAHPTFGTALGAAMEAASPGIGVAISCGEATNRYDIDVDGTAVFTVTWSSAAQLRMRALLGFNANISAPGVSTGTLTPMFSIEPAKQALGTWSDDVAMRDAVNVRVTSSGDLSTVGPARVPYTATFDLPHETDASTLSEFSTRYCWQQFWNDAGRNGRMCYLVDYDPAPYATMRRAFKLRVPTWDQSTHRRESPNLRNRWRVVFDVLVRGRW